ncbi:MAG: RNA polymerase sigma factor SigJ [Verrucomicrobiota bacterium]
MEVDATELFESHRRLLTSVAYRLLGSVSEAEDAVQDTFLRWNKVDPAQIQSPKSWLVKTCSRIALDTLRSVRVQRTEYIGPWLPEPFLEDKQRSPRDAQQIDESISMALLHALERLSPSERGSFILHDVFDYSFSEVSDILNKSPESCRKLASRARAHIQEGKPRFSVSASDHQHLLTGFLQAARAGEFERLRSLLSPTVELHSDGGGKALAARRIVQSDELVTKFFVRVMGRNQGSGKSLSIREQWFNGAPGLIILENQTIVTALCFAVDQDTPKVAKIFAIRNPDKLRSLVS